MERKAESTMIENLHKNTGKTIDQWIEIAHHNKGLRHSETVNSLKDTYGLGLFYADLIVHKANKSDARSADAGELIVKQYRGKESLKPIYDHLIKYILGAGDDVEVAPKNAYVSLRRKKQFACLKPATKARFELELILKGHEASGVLEDIDVKGAMCTHRIKLESEDQITEEVLFWFKLAYTKSGLVNKLIVDIQ
ncbi:MAG TPA: DUF5655 domain-containing protein [Cytophagales bacterium]|nr:DUF5655 domain-containing protein [Cytophagales bacterium]